MELHHWASGAELALNRLFSGAPYVDLETFKGHTYPDVLLSVLIESFTRFNEWLNTTAINPANKRKWWQKWFGKSPTRKPLDRKAAALLSERLTKQITALGALLHGADNVASTAKTITTAEESSSTSASLSVAGKHVTGKLGAKRGGGLTKGHETTIQFQHSKTDFLHRHILEYRELFREFATLSDGDAFLFLDDLYYIRRADQASVIDYFHRIAKGNSLWLKVGTIRHRTRWYVHGDPSIGLKIGDDADDIDLDLTLEKFSITRSFLQSILRSFLDDKPTLSIDKLLTDGAFDRLVLASGGVARDFLNIFRRAIRVARERSGKGQQGEKIGVEDINNAAGEYESVKREELHRDAVDDQAALEEEFGEIAEFCKKSAKSSVFLLRQDATGDHVVRIQELVDLRLLHKVRQRVTVSHRKREVFEAYMLDVSQYTASRKMKDFEIVEFWRSENLERLRREALIYRDEEAAKRTPKPSNEG